MKPLSQGRELKSEAVLDDSDYDMKPLSQGRELK